MQPTIDLIVIGREKNMNWPHGKIFFCDDSVKSIYETIQAQIHSSSSDAWLFWDGNTALPAFEFLNKIMEQPVQVWHAGLKMGMRGLPHALDFVSPVWMLNCDAPSALETTSWRLSLKACLIRTDVLKQMGGIYSEFQSVEAAGLEMGHRFITRGVFMRHVPELADSPEMPVLKIPFEDEIRFIFYRHGFFWSRWSLFRAVCTGYSSLKNAVNVWNKIKNENRPETVKIYRHAVVSGKIKETPKVTVLIPTLMRYGYLRQLLPQLAGQTIPPLEIIIVDQTPENKRDKKIVDDFRNLPLRLIYQDEPGQCGSRNEGLLMAKGDRILFLDDDDEVFADCIEKHLECLKKFQTKVSSGVAYERGAGNLPENFSYARASDVFPTNNTMIEKTILEKSGLFDLAYNRKQRADGDLGMRVYLSGEQMILNPDIAVIHHHSSKGGLRAHKARKDTYAASRASLWSRRLLSDSEIYLAMRYFSKRQIREMIWSNIFSTFSFHGSKLKKTLKFLTALLQLPNTVFKIRKSYLSAVKMTKNFPQIQAFTKK